MMINSLFTAGYEKRSIDQFIALIKDNGVEVLADVRDIPFSRKRGFSKTALKEALEQAGIRYAHFREVGNPKHIRREATSIPDCLAKYDRYMASRWDEALPGLLDVVQSAPTCLMCFELDPKECHRTSVAKAISDRLPNLELIEL